MDTVRYKQTAGLTSRYNLYGLSRRLSICVQVGYRYGKTGSQRISYWHVHERFKHSTCESL